MALLRALLYLRVTSLGNVLRGRLRRLRQPKYLVGAIAGIAYLWFFFLRPATQGSGPGAAMQAAFGGGTAEMYAAILLSGFILFAWLLPGDRPGLAFTEAEVAFLFPAPLSRRQLIHYKLLDGLISSLLGALFFTLISSGGRLGWAASARHFGAWWSLNACLSLHQTAVALTVTRLSLLGLRAFGRRLVVVGAVVAFLAIALLVGWRFGFATLQPLLWPARLAVRPFLAAGGIDYLWSLLPAIGLVALHYLWVHRMEAPFEEASIGRAQRAAETLARLRSGRGIRVGSAPAKGRRDPFRLHPRLPAEFALLWKNLLAAPSYCNRRTFGILAAVIVVGLTWLRRQEAFGGETAATVAGFIALVVLGYVLLFGPQLARHDLRGDLLNADLLKGWPLPGWRIVLGSVLAPALLLTAIAWLMLLAAGCGLGTPKGLPWLTPPVRVAALGALAVVMPALCTLQLLVPNAATLLFPAWAQTQRSFGRGDFDVMGQRLIFFAGQFVCLGCALLPAVAAGALTLFLTAWLVGAPAAIGLAAIPVLLVLGVEVVLVVHWIGLRFEALDISAELRP